MSAAGFDPAPAVRRLAGMWRDMRQIDALPLEERPRNLVEAYAIQRRLIEEIGELVRGYKLGQSSVAAMERNGLGVPIMGFIPASRLSGLCWFEGELALAKAAAKARIPFDGAHLDGAHREGSRRDLLAPALSLEGAGRDVRAHRQSARSGVRRAGGDDRLAFLAMGANSPASPASGPRRACWQGQCK